MFKKVPIHEILRQLKFLGNCRRYEQLIFTKFRKVSIFLLNRLIRFGILRSHKFKGSVEYAWGIFFILTKITQIQSHLKLVYA